MKRLSPLVLAVTSLAALPLAAQAPPPRAVALRPAVSSRQLEMDRGAAAVWQSLKKLHTRASLLLIVAHPDDEDGGMLTLESRGQGVRTALLTLNRGEGGENLMSNDFYDALGLVRTQELLAADRYYGVQQYFTRVVDFGFSKTKAETLAQWGHERLLADAVRVVRMVRPLVLASVFVGGPSDGHGNHAAAGQITQELFNAAGNPKMFPDQIREGLRPWNPLKVYARDPIAAFTPKGIYDYANQVYTPGRIFDFVHQRWIEGPPSVTVQAQYGGYDPVLGSSYVQIARQGLSQQRTQLGGIGVPDLGPASTPYHRYGSRVEAPAQEQGFFDGIDTSLVGIADLAQGEDAQHTAALRARLAAINQDVEQAMAQFRAAAPDRIAPLLAQGLAATNALLAQVRAGSLSPEAKYDIAHELEIKQAQFNDAIVEALGLAFTARVQGPGRGGRGGPAVTILDAIPGQRLQVETSLANPSPQAVELESVALQNPPGQPQWTVSGGLAIPASLADNDVSRQHFQVAVPADAPYTRPYYSRPNTEQPYYRIDDRRSLTLPTAPYPLAAWAHLLYRGVPLAMGQVVETVQRPQTSGLVENPLQVAPAISVAIAPAAGIIPLPAAALSLTVTIHSNVPGPAAGQVRLRLPPGWTASPATAGFALQHDGEDQPVTFRIQPRAVTTQAYTLTAVASYQGHDYEEGYHTAGYPGLRPYNFYSPAIYRTRGVPVAIAPKLNVAYVTGTGDNVPQSLENLGVHVHFLSPADLASGNLRPYDAIVLGIRAYAARPDLRTHNGRLLDYVKNGGVLIVQYQTSEFDHNYGPYPYHLGGSGATVVDERSAVEILQPANPVLRWPNPIGQADFADWVEERGHGFIASWDPRYTPLVEMHDAQQPPQKGGLLYAPYGKGVYVYEGLALYRQLAEAVPGAYRLFANLLSLARRPGR
ncbi:MAG TPA: PIG-L family deacetylase [Terriglobales bacterium]|nr:PIG-L family deacetylase [Terriglobales bacterium]